MRDTHEFQENWATKKSDDSTVKKIKVYCKFLILRKYLILWFPHFASNHENIKSRAKTFCYNFP